MSFLLIVLPNHMQSRLSLSQPLPQARQHFCCSLQNSLPFISIFPVCLASALAWVGEQARNRLPLNKLQGSLRLQAGPVTGFADSLDILQWLGHWYQHEERQTAKLGAHEGLTVHMWCRDADTSVAIYSFFHSFIIKLSGWWYGRLLES